MRDCAGSSSTPGRAAPARAGTTSTHVNNSAVKMLHTRACAPHLVQLARHITRRQHTLAGLHASTQAADVCCSCCLQPRITVDHHSTRHTQWHTVQRTIHQRPQPEGAGRGAGRQLQQLPVAVGCHSLLLPEEAPDVAGGQQLHATPGRNKTSGLIVLCCHNQEVSCGRIMCCSPVMNTQNKCVAQAHNDACVTALRQHLTCGASCSAAAGRRPASTFRRLRSCLPARHRCFCHASQPL